MYSKIKIPIKGDLYEFAEFSQLLQERITDIQLVRPIPEKLLLVSNLEVVLEKVKKVLETPILNDNRSRKVTVNFAELVSIRKEVKCWNDGLNVFMGQIDLATVNFSQWVNMESDHVPTRFTPNTSEKSTIPLLSTEIRYVLDSILKITLQALNLTEFDASKRDKFNLMVRYIVLEIFLKQYPNHESALAGYFARFHHGKHLDRTSIIVWHRKVREFVATNYMDFNGYVQRITNRLVNPEIN